MTTAEKKAKVAHYLKELQKKYSKLKSFTQIEAEESGIRINVEARTYFGDDYEFEEAAGMESQESPFCCGIVEIGNFPSLSAITPLQEAVIALWVYATQAASVMATTAHGSGRKDPLAPMLKRIGFTPISAGNNPNSGNNVTIWLMKGAK